MTTSPEDYKNWLERIIHGDDIGFPEAIVDYETWKLRRSL